MTKEDRKENNKSENLQLELGGEDWPAIVADKIVTTVGTIRSHTIDNLSLIVRSMVYGLVAISAFMALLVLSIVAAVRLADAHLPIGDGIGSATWTAHAFIGALVTILGLGTWKARTSTARPIFVAIAIDFVLILSVMSYALLR
ncbi:MAG: hypothetical protein OXI96_01270 [Acidimicrobiaceae bacterium]|nr:hypothetical protein [Acidimicrobiaceae bacterium]